MEEDVHMTGTTSKILTEERFKRVLGSKDGDRMLVWALSANCWMWDADARLRNLDL